MRDKNESPRVTVSNYTKIWNLEFVIYALEGRKLPLPANLKVIGIWFVCEFIFWLLGKTILFFLPPIYSYLALPIGATWLIAKQKLDGKAPHRWLLGMFFYWMRPKRIHRYHKFQHLNRYKYGCKITYRNEERGRE